MPADPWTSPDPQPGDFDAELAALDPSQVEWHRDDPEARLIVVDDDTLERDGQRGDSTIAS